MRKWLTLLMMLPAGFGIAGDAWGQSAQTGGTKIAFLDSTAVLQGVAEGQKELSELEQWIRMKETELAPTVNEVELLRSEYESKQRMLNPSTLADMQRQIAEKERRVTRAQEDTELELNRRRDNLLERMSAQIQAVVAEYAQQNGIGVVFLETPNLPFFAEALDITDEIIQAYDAKHPVAGAAAGTPQEPSSP